MPDSASQTLLSALPLPPASTDAGACEALARSHYENFPIVTRFFPEALRRPMFTVYAFCRYTDDLGDEAPGDRMALLELWSEALALCDPNSEAQPEHPILRELRSQVIEPFGAPIEVFERLVEANRRDQLFKRFETHAALLEYCHFSATPVGTMVLYLMGEATPENIALSDEVCIGLQLANFWQDVSEDWEERQRIYISLQDLEDFGLTEENIAAQDDTPQTRALITELVGRARDHFHQGASLEQRVAPRFQLDLALFRRGGMAILDAIERLDHRVLAKRPSISKPRMAGMIFDAWVQQRVERTRVRLGRPTPLPLPPPKLDHATLQRCGAVDAVTFEDTKTLPEAPIDPAALSAAQEGVKGRVKAAAGSFYQAFRLLPVLQANAIFALYLFCRLADDIVDEPGFSDETRARRLDHLDAAVSAITKGKLPKAEDDLEADLWITLAHTLSQYPIAPQDLHLIVEGCRMDLHTTRYQTFEDLMGYCYKVASVVALLVTPVFDDDPTLVRPYARYGGFAIQLTNILRDVAEDAERDRIYLPLDDLAAFGVSEEEILNKEYSENFAALLCFEVRRARSLYAATDARLPPIRRGRHGMLESIRTIYGALLDEIEAIDGDVFTHRVSLPTGRKLTLALKAQTLGRLATSSEHIARSVSPNPKSAP